MNKSYISIWSEALGSWVPASENTTARGKRSKSRVAVGVAAVAVVLGGLPGCASAATPDLTTVYNSGTRYFAAGGLADGTDDASASGQSVAVGASSSAANGGGHTSVAIGKSATTTYGGSVAIGESAFAGGGDSSAIGRGASTVNVNGANNQIALGTFASTGALGAIALGGKATASAQNAIAFGASSSATAVNSVALGAGATTTANLTAAGYNPGSMALSGVASTASGEASVGSAGNERRVTNVAAGSAATDAVNVSQLQSEAAKSSAGIGALSNSLNTMDGRVTNVEGSVMNLTQQLSTGQVGLVKQDTTTNAISVASDKAGSLVDFTGTEGVRTLSGVKAGTLADGSTEAVNGSQLFSTNARMTAAENNIAQNTIDISNMQNQLSGGSIGLVQQDSTGVITVGANTGGTLVNMAGMTGNRVVTGVANGAVNASSADAVNGSQLYALQSQVADIGTQVSNITQTSQSPNANDRPAITGTATNPANAGEGAAVKAGDMAANTVATGADSTAIGTGAQATSRNSVALGQGSTTERDNSVSVGSSAQQRQVTNVAAGTADTDAVNVGQMNTSVSQGVQQANSYTDQRFNQTNEAINDVARNAYAGIAAAMAMPNMTPSGPGRTIVAAGGATYKGGSAAAMGVTHRSRNGKWLTNGAISVTSTGDAGVRAQLGYEF